MIQGKGGLHGVLAGKLTIGNSIGTQITGFRGHVIT